MLTCATQSPRRQAPRRIVPPVLAGASILLADEAECRYRPLMSSCGTP
jgi:hypothetical protein